MPLVRRRGPSPASLFLVAWTRPSRCLRSASICFVVFLFIAAAPRPLRLRRGFVVTTAPLNDMLTLTTYDFLLQLCDNFKKETINLNGIFLSLSIGKYCRVLPVSGDTKIL